MARHPLVTAWWILLLAITALGCGTTKSQLATEQLLLSDAVDRSIAALDFRPLAGKTVFLDTQFIRPVKGPGFVNADYIISSLRQQMFAARCLVQEDQAKADYVVEARVGALGANSHDVTYGMPANNLVSAATSIVPNAPVIPAFPELSVAKRNDQVGAAKIGVFAYHRETREPVWQAGITQSRSTAKSMWLFGAGPFQRGTIYDKPQFAGEQLTLPLLGDDEGKPSEVSVDYYSQWRFRDNAPPTPAGLVESVRAAGHTEPLTLQFTDSPPDETIGPIPLGDANAPNSDPQPSPPAQSSGEGEAADAQAKPKE